MIKVVEYVENFGARLGFDISVMTLITMFLIFNLGFLVGIVC